MRHTLVVLFSLVLSVSTARADDDIQNLAGCWTSIVDFDEVSNFIVMCIKDAEVKSIAFFPNSGTNRTICRQRGRVALGRNGSSIIQLDNGTCENGRELAGEIYECVYVNADQLSCLIDAAINLVFRRV